MDVCNETCKLWSHLSHVNPICSLAHMDSEYKLAWNRCIRLWDNWLMVCTEGLNLRRVRVDEASLMGWVSLRMDLLLGSTYLGSYQHNKYLLYYSWHPKIFNNFERKTQP